MANQSNYESLAPKSNVELNEYERAIDYALQEKTVHNIALSGAYGSGKSSILRSYEQKHQDKRFIHISLAHFDEQNCGKSEEKTLPDSLSKVLEGKILNQLLHQIDLKLIPQSRFPVKKEISNCAVFWRVFCCNTLFFPFSVYYCVQQMV